MQPLGNGTMTSSDELRKLIDQVCSYPDRSKERQKALNKLLILIQQLPGIRKSCHPDYPEALNRTWEWLCRDIGKFDELRSDKVDLQQSLVAWINGYLKWRIQDLYTPDSNFTISLDKPIANNEGGETKLLDILPDPKFLDRSLDLLDINGGDKNWQPIRDKLIAISQQLPTSNEETRILIDVKDVDLRRLPWQEWNLFEQHYPQTEVALCAPKDKETIKARPKSQNIRILVAVGRSDGINTADDLKVIQELKKHGATTVILMQPSRQELCEALWDDQGYHIFVFTGHSGSREDGQIGWIELNDTDSLKIEEFKNALKEAINKGLQLAIFNSCDGLGLANQLAQLHLPQCIVMREPVPDKVAIEFLKNFFNEFSANNSLFTSVHKARKRLEPFQLDYPGAVWLPTICIEPNVEPLTWQGLVLSKSSSVKPNIRPWIITGLAVLVVGCGAYAWHIRSSQPPEGEFFYAGSTSWQPINKLFDEMIKGKWEKLYKFKLTRIKPDGPGTKKGIEMLLEGRSSFAFALASRRLKDEEIDRAKNYNVTLEEFNVAMDGIAITVHKDLNIESLSKEQLKDIYTGKTTNWKSINGVNQPITLYIRDESGTLDYFKETVLEVKEINGNKINISTTTEALQQLNKNPGGIYFASAVEVIKQCGVKTIGIKSTNQSVNYPYVKPKNIVLNQQCPQKFYKVNKALYCFT